MISPESTEILKQLARSQFGKALEEFLDSEIAEIGDITKVESWDDALGRKHSIKTLKKLFSFMDERKVIGRKSGQYE